MELAKKFEETTSCQPVNICSLETDKTYPIVRAKRMTNKFGPTVLLTIRDLNPPPSRPLCRKDRVLSFWLMI